jgi:hypothetical protein
MLRRASLGSLEINMFADYETVGAARSLNCSVSRIRFRRLVGQWPATPAGPKRRGVDREIDLLVQQEREELLRENKQLRDELRRERFWRNVYRNRWLRTPLV